MKIQGLEEMRRWEDMTESELLVVTTVHTAVIEGNIPGLTEIFDSKAADRDLRELEVLPDSRGQCAGDQAADP